MGTCPLACLAVGCLALAFGGKDRAVGADERPSIAPDRGAKAPPATILAPSAPLPIAAAGVDFPVGWASAEGGTRGGQGGPTVRVSDAKAFRERVQSEGPLIVQVSGTIRLPSCVLVRSDKTIIGLGSDATITGGGLKVFRSHNVIIRNLAITDAPDAIAIDGSHHVWVDHCDLSACRDGLLDINRNADFISVSWNHFHDHHKTCLLGNSDTEDARRLGTGHLRVTYHHNFFDGTESRHPRVRFAEPVHVFNNYFLKNGHGVVSVMDAGVLVEGNYFEGVRHPTHTQYGDSPDPGRLVERDNVYVECEDRPQVRGTVKEPRDTYAYTLESAADVPEIVKSRSGVGKVQ